MSMTVIMAARTAMMIPHPDMTLITQIATSDHMLPLIQGITGKGTMMVTLTDFMNEGMMTAVTDTSTHLKTLHDTYDTLLGKVTGRHTAGQR